MFPFDLDEDDLQLERAPTREQTDYEIDFTTGKLTGKIITGLDAVKQWVRLALGIDRYYYSQYSWEYGSDLSSLIGKGYSKDYTESEIRRMVTEVLEQNNAITGISDFSCVFNDSKLAVNFKLETIYGEELIQFVRG